MLCSICLSLSKGPYGPKTYHESLLDLENAARSGCWICVRVVETAESLEVDKFGPSPRRDQIVPFSVQLSRIFGLSTTCRHSSLEFRWIRSYDAPSTSFDFVAMDSDEQDQSLGGFGESTKSLQSLDFLKNCIDKCLRDHASCRRNLEKKPGWYPTRLVQVGNPGGSHDMVRVVTTAETSMSPGARYITLSHCWGSGHPLTLTKDPANRLYSGLPISELPVTFQDAIYFAQFLKIDYLWIDSLCVIQDSDGQSDWRRESALMDRVYEHGYCNIAAAAASNSNGGLFRQRHPDALIPQIMNLEAEPIQKFRIYHPSLYSNLDREPLYKRGWVVQERMLAPRIASFGHREVFFECRQTLMCEEDTEGEPRQKSLYWRGSHKIYPPWASTFHRIMDLSSFPETEFFEVWWYLIEIYSSTNLTYGADKLIAISGMAKRLQDDRDTTYLAGLWEHDIAGHLAWHARGRASDRVRPKTYQGPSWSWASVNTGVSNYLTYFGKKPYSTPRVTLVSWTIDPVGEDPFGQLVYASIRLRGEIYPVSITSEDGRPRLEHGKDTALHLDYHDWTLPQEFYAMPVLVKRDGTVSLLLLRALVPAKGTFVRVGQAQVAIEAEVKDMAGTTELGRSAIPCEEYDPALGHIITMI